MAWRTYNLSDQQVLELTRLCLCEQDSPDGSAAEMSLMCNKFEKQSKYSSLHSYVRDVGWWAHAATYMQTGGPTGEHRNPSQSQINIIRGVLQGKRTLPSYVDEHDCINPDILRISTGDKNNRANYIKHQTKVYTKYNGNNPWTFYCFPASNSDPFGYTCSTEEAMRIGDQGVSTGTGGGSEGITFADTPSAYAAGVAAKILPSQEEITEYIVSVDQGSPTSLDYNALKSFGVMTTCVDIGSYFTPQHSINDPMFDVARVEDQIRASQSNKVPIALSATTRARSVEEAQAELYELMFPLRKYHPSMGFWLKMDFGTNKEINDKIINAYYDRLMELGFNDQMGLYTTKDNLKKITWKDHYDKWYLWLDDHVKDVNEIPVPLTPDFFMCRDVS